jgi:hypothetical protein
MANGGGSRLEAWLGLVKAFVWPCAVIGILLLFRANIIALLPRVTEMDLPGGTAVKLAEQRLTQQITQIAGSTDSPSDPKMALAVKALTDAKHALVASASGFDVTATRTGWLYVGEATEDGKWTSPPHLVVETPSKLVNGNTYSVRTDIYLRDAPPQGAARLKGNVIAVVPEGTRVRLIEVQSIEIYASNPALRVYWTQVVYNRS